MIDIKQLEAFCKVIRCGSFDQAAQALNLTSSAISQRVKALEEHIGVPLLLRGTNTATPAGASVLEYANKLELLEHDLTRKIKPALTDEYMHATLAVNVDSLSTWFQEVYVQLIKTIDVLPEIVIDDQSATFEHLSKGRAVGCVSSIKATSRSVSNALLGHMDYTCVAHVDFAKKWFPSGLSLHQALKAPAIVYNSDDGLHDDLMHRVFGLKKVHYPKTEMPSQDGIIHATFNQCGYCMVPTALVQAQLDRGEFVDLTPQHHYLMPLYWIHWKDQNQHSPLYQQISNIVLATAKKCLIQKDTDDT